MKTVSVNIESVIVQDRHRQLDKSKLKPLATSMSDIGLMHPITVRTQSAGDDIDVILVTGLHRLEAARGLGWADIEAFDISTMDETDRELWEIDENLMRADLSEADRTQHVIRRKQLWEQRNKGGKSIPTPGGEQKIGFAKETAERTGVSKRAVNQALSRETIPTSILAMIKGTSLDRGVYLDALKTLPKEGMADKVRRDLEANRRATIAANEIKQQTPSRVIVQEDKGDPDMADVAKRLANRYTAGQLQEIVDHLTEIIMARCGL